jgi:hypothetical protein
MAALPLSNSGGIGNSSLTADLGEKRKTKGSGEQGDQIGRIFALLGDRILWAVF